MARLYIPHRNTKNADLDILYDQNGPFYDWLSDEGIARVIAHNPGVYEIRLLGPNGEFHHGGSNQLEKAKDIAFQWVTEGVLVAPMMTPPPKHLRTVKIVADGVKWPAEDDSRWNEVTNG